ncbi:tyrosine phosphatase-like protein [Abortiporus biennis]|nr:tyrosine phosphatase-like protein [Abortiporus biennis]
MARIEEVKEHIPRSQTKKEKREQPALIKYYLVAYNVFSVVGWSYVLICTIIHLFALDTWHHSAPSSIFATLSKKFASIPYFSTSPLFRPKSTAWVEPYLHPALIPVVRRATTVYARIGYQATIVQSFAILEVLHSLLGWVRSPLTTTLMQVSSRLYVVWGVLPLFPHTQSNPFVASAFLSWSITEVIRYTFYALNLLKIQSSILLYIRYTAFYLLYPTGASSEAFLILNSIPQTVPSGLHEYLRASLFTIWWPSLYVLYTHMIKQRRKILGGGKGKGRTIGGKPKSL